jgi:DNA-binding MarR family transcriptional regulator
MKTLTTEDRVALNKAISLLDIFRRIDPKTETTISEAISLILISLGEDKMGGGLTVTELGKRGEFSMASASRYIKSLSVLDRQGRTGLGLVTAMRNPIDDRRKVLRISADGSTVISKIINTMEK